MSRVLIIANHYPNRSPGQRFRFEQYLNYLNNNGFECTISYIISEDDDKYFYKPGNYIKKAFTLLKSLWIRFFDLKKIKSYDLVLLFREALPIGTIFFEKALKNRGAKIIFDFDDSIWMSNVSKANRSLAFLKNSSKTSKLVALSNLVLVGNSFLKSYAEKFNNNVRIVPTTIDTKNYHKKVKSHVNKDKIIIGWTGSHSTLKYLRLLNGVIEEVSSRFSVSIVIISDGNLKLDWDNLRMIPWQRDTEIEDLFQIDIGLMPLPETEWAKGKCGFKILQYQALGIPAIGSPVGVNSEIIQHGENGFLASTDDEWVKYISALIESPELRNRIGIAGRKTVEEKYSVEANKHLYLQYFNEVLNS